MAYTKKTWVKGSTPLSAENFNHMEQGIADAHSSIAQLNSDSVFEERSSPNLYVKRNKDIAIVSAFFGANLTGGNTDNTYKLPNGVNFTCSLFAPCEILDQNWTPIGNSGYISVNGNKLTVRCATSISNGVVIANIVAPASLVQFI